MDHFFLPLLLQGFQEVGSYFLHPTLEGTPIEDGG
jgi:hypothetical protein